jgi:hypothetical protein
MAAFNWIEIEGACPCCGQQGIIRCQTHVASDYDGDATGRFHERSYRLGERMAWWPPGHPSYEHWREASEPGRPEGETVEAACATCGSCAAELYAVLRFRDLRPVEVLKLGPERDWPPGYSR